jgi:hypothetical protein
MLQQGRTRLGWRRGARLCALAATAACLGPALAAEPAPAPESAAEAVDIEADDEVAFPLKAILESELRFVQKVCSPTPGQMAALRAVGEQSRKELARLLSQEPAAKVAYLDPTGRITGALRRQAESLLPAEAVARYREELSARSTFNNEAAIRLLLVQLDQHLAFSTEQDDQAVERLRGRGLGKWEQSPWIINESGMSAWLPQSVLNPVLSAHQIRMWKLLQEPARATPGPLDGPLAGIEVFIDLLEIEDLPDYLKFFAGEAP